MHAFSVTLICRAQLTGTPILLLTVFIWVLPSRLSAVVFNCYWASSEWYEVLNIESFGSTVSFLQGFCTWSPTEIRLIARIESHLFALLSKLFLLGCNLICWLWRLCLVRFINYILSVSQRLCVFFCDLFDSFLCVLFRLFSRTLFVCFTCGLIIQVWDSVNFTVGRSPSLREEKKGQGAWFLRKQHIVCKLDLLP